MISKEEKHLRLDFPMLQKKVNEAPIVYLDNAATTFKPKSVIDAVCNYYQNESATVHRSVYELSNTLNAKYHQIREQVQKFIHANSSKEIIFTPGATMSLNLLAYSFGDAFIQSGDEILISEIEHHSNLVPWQMLAKRKNVVLKFIPTLQSSEIDLKALKTLLTDKTKLVCFAHVSNVTGVIHPVKEIAKLVKQYSCAKVAVDGAQAISHMPVDVQDLDADFYIFSAHKMYGPTGLGILYGKESLLEIMPPVFGGGDMIEKVSKEETTYNALPFKFEAGTPNIAGVMGLGAAMTYIENLGFDWIEKKEKALLEHALKSLHEISDVQIIGNSKNRAGLISFQIEGIHNLDVITLLNFKAIALRSGHLCAQTALERFNLTSLLRISFAVYNTLEEVNFFIASLKEVISKLKN